MLSLALVAGCASSGRKFQTDSIPKIEPGRTTDNQIRDMFGEPVSVRTRGSGGSTWRYDFRERRTADTSFFSRLGGFIAALFGVRGVRSPVNVAYSNEIRHQLTVVFHRDGVVDDFTYDRTENPSQRVY